MYKQGKVIEVDYAKGYAKVEFPEDGGMRSDWLQVVQSKTKTDKFYSMPDIGEYVACVMDENAESGCITGAVYADDNPPEGGISGEGFASIKFGDGVTVHIGRADGFVVVTCTKKVRMVVGSKSVELTGSGLAIVGNTTIEGNLSVDGAITATEGISANGDIASEGNITAKGNIIAGPPGATVSLRTHLHPTPAGASSPPTPGT